MLRTDYQSDMSLDERVIMAMVRVAELFKKKASAVFKNYDLTFSQYNALRVLDASKDGKNTMSNVSRIMLVSGANMTGIAKRLEKNGFLIRKGDPRDDRIKWLEITPKGSQTLNDISREKERIVSRFLREYPETEKKALLNTLREILKTSK
jgi:MarR family 2-MHQ and catechol resistance regulon transcriptional repressor